MALRVSLDNVVEGFKREFGREPEVIASAPARIDLLNTHQDYKGLPVVGAGVSLRCYVAVAKSRTGLVEVVSENLRREGRFHRDVFNPIEPSIVPNWFGTYVRAVYVAMTKLLSFTPPPAEIYILSEIPIGSGLASSAALEVATALALARLGGIDMSKLELAEVSYVAEHDVANIPCGRLDQYSSSFGGIVFIRTKPPYGVRQLPNPGGIFITIDSGERHSTAAIHPVRQREIDEGLTQLLSMPDLPPKLKELLGSRYWEPKWEEISEELLEPYLKRLSPVPRKRILYTLKCHRSTILAVEVLEGLLPDEDTLSEALSIPIERARQLLSDENPKLAILAEVMNYQHALLRDLYDVSTPRLEELRNASLRAGALGCKISGAGLGGSLAAIARTADVADEVARACLVLGAPLAMPVRIDDGAKVELG